MEEQAKLDDVLETKTVAILRDELPEVTRKGLVTLEPE